MGKIGKNSLDIQESNRLSILRILAGEDVLTRAELSRRTGLKQATITNIINDFLASGVVSETGALKGNLGRRSIGIRINAAHADHAAHVGAQSQFSAQRLPFSRTCGRKTNGVNTVHRQRYICRIEAVLRRDI